MIQKLWARFNALPGTIRRDLGFFLILLVLVFSGIFAYKSCTRPAPITTKITDNNTTVTTQGTTVAAKDAVKVLDDKTNVEAILAENKKLKIQVTQLTETLAKTTSHGSGVVTLHPILPTAIVVPGQSQPALASNPITSGQQNIDFQDWRLHFWTTKVVNTDQWQGDYILAQQFEILNSSGKTKDGTIANVVKLFEIGPKGERIPIETVKTTSVVAVDSGKHWFLSPTLQAGYGLVVGDSVRSQGAIVGLQLFKRGTSRAAEDSSISLLTPAIFLTDTIRQPGILPISVNIGRLKYQPFKDLWVSPFVGYDVTKRGIGKLGGTLTASF